MMQNSIKLFTCPRIPGSLRLSKSACSSNYVKSKKIDGFERWPHCQNCAVGQKNSNQSDVSKPIKANNSRKKVLTNRCIRCNKASDRIIYKTLCINCANRQTELFRGSNARGASNIKLKLFVIQLNTNKKITKNVCTNLIEYIYATLLVNNSIHIKWPDLNTPILQPIAVGSGRKYLPLVYKQKLLATKQS